MGLDTVGNPCPSTPPRFLTPPPSLGTITPHRSRDQDECFACGMRGHWASSCPNKFAKISHSSNPGSSIDASDLPLLRCPCDSGVCLLLTSRTQLNPNRKYYTCPIDRSKGEQCGFFKWCDEIKAVPNCGCGAGACSLNRTSNGPDEGKWYFACRIKKNHGACDFFQWADNELNSKLFWKKRGKKGCSFRQPNFNAGDNDLGSEEVNLNNPINVLQSDQGEDSNRGLIVQVVDSPNTVIGNELQVYQSKLIPANETHSLKDLRSNKANAGITINEGISPSFNPIVHPEDDDVSGVERSSPSQTPGKDVKVVGGFHPLPVVLKNTSGDKQDNDAFLKSVFRKLAQLLFDILEEIGPHEPEQMSKAAEAIFSSLQKLSIDCGPFVRAVKDYIHNLSKLSSIEGSMQNCPSSQELINLCENEKARFNDISRCHKEALAAYTDAEIHRQSLQEEILQTKGVLIRLEEQLLCCEAETSAYKARSDEISKEMLESEKRVQDVAFDLAEAIELEKQREWVSKATKTAFEAAKIWLEK